MLLRNYNYYVDITITNGPQNTTVCMNATAEINCGYTGADPYTVVPEWKITLRSDDGSIISNYTVDGFTIIHEPINGLQWLPDLTSGTNTSPNSKLLIGPVNNTHNQSSYQCVIDTGLLDPSISEVGTITVVGKTTCYYLLLTLKLTYASFHVTGPPSVMINVDEICTTSITILLNTYSHPACGDVSHNVTISGNVIYPDTINGSKYTIDNLQNDTLYNITVTSMNNSGSRTLTQSVNTFLPKCKSCKTYAYMHMPMCVYTYVHMYM